MKSEPKLGYESEIDEKHFLIAFSNLFFLTLSFEFGIFRRVSAS